MDRKEMLVECRKSAEYKEFLARQRAANKGTKRQTKKEADKWAKQRQKRKRFTGKPALSSFTGIISVPSVK